MISLFIFSVKAGLLRGVPDLGGRLARAGKLSKESTFEQSKINFKEMTSEETMKIVEMNEKYKDKFGFPFVICARKNQKDTLLPAMESRFEHDLKQELINGIEQVLMICELRVRDIVIPLSNI